MGRLSGDWSPDIELGVTWEDTVQLLGENEDPVDITGYSAVLEFYADRPVRDPDTGLATVEPVLQLTTASFHGTAPDWPSAEALSIDTGTDGMVTIRADVADLWNLSPENEKTKLYMALVLIGDDDYRIPATNGRAAIMPAGVLVPSP
jgi:hypothetical protein